jgi:hypothetical protein
VFLFLAIDRANFFEHFFPLWLTGCALECGLAQACLGEALKYSLRVLSTNSLLLSPSLSETLSFVLGEPPSAGSPRQVQLLLTLFAKFFSPFEQSTCALSNTHCVF